MLKELKVHLSKVYFELKESETPLVQQLKSFIKSVTGLLILSSDLPALIQRLQSSQIELQDIADDLDSISNHVNYDPEKIEQLNERFSLGYKLMKKHGVKTTNELLAIQNQLEEKLQAVLNIDDSYSAKRKGKCRN